MLPWTLVKTILTSVNTIFSMSRSLFSFYVFSGSNFLCTPRNFYWRAPAKHISSATLFWTPTKALLTTTVKNLPFKTQKKFRITELFLVKVSSTRVKLKNYSRKASKHTLLKLCKNWIFWNCVKVCFLKISHWTLVKAFLTTPMKMI